MNHLHRRHFLSVAAGAAGAAAWPWSAALASEAFPTKPLTIMVPYPAGGASDMAARIFAEAMSKTLNHQVLVENLGGGTGVIAANKVLGLPANGYMMFHGSANEVFLAPMLNPAAKYKPTDFSLAVPTTEAAIVLMVRGDLPVNTYDEFIEFAQKSGSKQLTYCTVGLDSLYNLMGDALAAQLKLPFLHVPYKGAAPALQDLAGGQVDFAILPYQNSFDAMAKQGRLKVLTSFSRLLPPSVAHLPLISSSKYTPDFEYAIGGGYFVKKGTPADRAAVIRKAIVQALVDPTIKAKFEMEGRLVRSPAQSQEEADQVFQSQYNSLQKLIKMLGRTPLA